jgi:putative transposase
MPPNPMCGAEAAVQRGAPRHPTAPGAANEHWAMDFIHDQLADGTAFRVLSIVDLYTRECVGLVPAVRLR